MDVDKVVGFPWRLHGSGYMMKGDGRPDPGRAWEGHEMVIWILRDDEMYLTGAGERVPVEQVNSYSDICDLHVCEFTDEAEALEEAEALNRGSGQNWVPAPSTSRT
jgi:hypothetical protein